MRRSIQFLAMAMASVALAALVPAQSLAIDYYWDSNNGTAGFGSTNGTWAAPTTGTATNGWSTNAAGTTAISGNSVTTTTGDALNFGTATDGYTGQRVITVSGTVNAGSIVRGAASTGGIMSLNTGTINFAAAGAITNNSLGAGDSLAINATITGGGTSMTYTTDGLSGGINLTSASNSYAGATIVGANTLLRVNSIANGGVNSTLGSSSNAASNFIFNDGAQLRYDGGAGSTNRNFTINGSSATIYSRASSGTNLTWNGTAFFGTPNQAATLRLQSNVGDGVFNGLLADNGSGQLSLEKTLATSWTLNAANTHSGSTSITGGILVVGNASALQNSYIDTTASIAGDATNGLRTTGAALNLGGLSGNKNLASIYTTTTGGYASVTGITLNVAAANNLDYSGVIDGGRSLNKTGNGTQTLSGANTYTGATAVNAGTLRVNGSLAAGTAVTVGAGGTLGGNGTINGALTLNGSLAPGNSIDTLNVANDVTWNGSASTPWVFELGALDTADLLNITGGTSDFLRGTGTVGTDFVFDFAASTDQGTFDLVTWAGTTTFGASDFAFTNLGGGNSGSFAINGSTLQFIAVPEPTTLALLACGGVMALAIRRRLRRAS